MNILAQLMVWKLYQARRWEDDRLTLQVLVVKLLDAIYLVTLSLCTFCSLVKIKASDPINQLSLEDSVRGNLQTCATLHGDSFNAAISSMHPAAFAQLKQALKMP